MLSIFNRVLPALPAQPVTGQQNSFSTKLPFLQPVAHDVFSPHFGMASKRPKRRSHSPHTPDSTPSKQKKSRGTTQTGAPAQVSNTTSTATASISLKQELEDKGLKKYFKDNYQAKGPTTLQSMLKTDHGIDTSLKNMTKYAQDQAIRSGRKRED